MQSRFIYGAATLALLACVTFALAQTPNTNTKRDSGSGMPPPPSAQMPPAPSAKLQSQPQAQAQVSLSSDQKQAIWDSVGKGKGAKAPANFQASIGANVPAQLALRPLPSTLNKQVPDAKKYHYAKVADEVVLVDPSTHKVIDIIKQ